ncbi:SRPBCC family protein [Rhizobium sp. GN54]|uniref:SRPBCC family protein n=1 Tax=Rhizobium sp. GN54 TaxID=2898150 RepID=UPI001E4E157C|nr:SRPBCC domain-containing protein [Rhizobium sp. GN54]MCD2181687.1 SRPBCC domain-containing protein [Rhizobium sp. GN54]
MTILQRVAARAENALYLERRFDAPPAVVFQLWTAPERVALWWGPRDFTTHSIEMDFRPGGTWSAAIRSPFGEDTPMLAVYREIVTDQRIAFTLIPDDGHKTNVVVTFEAVKSTTRLAIRQSPLAGSAEVEAYTEGWHEYIDRLESYLLRRHWDNR